MKDPVGRKGWQPAEAVAGLRLVDEGVAAVRPIAEVVRSLGVAPATLHGWRKE